MANVFGRQFQQAFVVFAARIADLVLKVGIGCLVGIDEALLLRRLMRVEVVQHFAAGREDVGQGFVAMYVEKQVAAGFVHFAFDGEHFGAVFQARRHPFAIQIGAGGVGAQIAAHRAVGIHVRHDIKHRLLQQGAGQRIGLVEQGVEHAFDKPFGHGFARMLARDDPDFARCLRIAYLQQIQIAAVDGIDQMFAAHERRAFGARQQGQMALPGIGLEIGVIDAVGFGRMLDSHDLAVERGRNAEPALAVGTGDGAVVLPAARIGALACVGEADFAGLAARALQAEIEPLGEVRRGVLGDMQFDVVGAFGADRGNCAGVEIAADFNWH